MHPKGLTLRLNCPKHPSDQATTEPMAHSAPAIAAALLPDAPAERGLGSSRFYGYGCVEQSSPALAPNANHQDHEHPPCFPSLSHMCITVGQESEASATSCAVWPSTRSTRLASCLFAHKLANSCSICIASHATRGKHDATALFAASSVTAF